MTTTHFCDKNSMTNTHFCDKTMLKLSFKSDHKRHENVKGAEISKKSSTHLSLSLW